jgi:hypothetical protein
MSRTENYGNGIFVVKNAVKISEQQIKDILEAVDVSFEGNYEFVRDDEGKILYGINKSHHRVDVSKLYNVPIRVNAALSSDFLEFMENEIYKNVFQYLEIYPDVLPLLWWKVTGHVAAYNEGANLGAHSDNDSNYMPGYIPVDQTSIHHVLSNIVMLNEEYEGGEFYFDYLDLTLKLEKGDILYFPSNYVATHQVKEVTSGTRLSYVSWFGQGSPAPDRCLSVREKTAETLHGRYWINSLREDFKNYLMDKFDRNFALPNVFMRTNDHE